MVAAEIPLAHLQGGEGPDRTQPGTEGFRDRAVQLQIPAHRADSTPARASWSTPPPGPAAPSSHTAVAATMVNPPPRCPTRSCPRSDRAGAQPVIQRQRPRRARGVAEQAMGMHTGIRLGPQLGEDLPTPPGWADGTQNDPPHQHANPRYRASSAPRAPHAPTTRTTPDCEVKCPSTGARHKSQCWARV